MTTLKSLRLSRPVVSKTVR